MNNNALISIAQAKTMPSMALPGIAGTLVEVKELKTVQGAKGPITAQGFKIQDGQDWMFADAWGFGDLTPYRGQHVIFVSNKSGNGKIAGVAIKEKASPDGSKTYKNLSINSAATMHTRETYEASNGAPAPSVVAPVAPVAPAAAPFVPKPAVVQPAQQMPPIPQQMPPVAAQPLPAPARAPAIMGVTVGMSINNAINLLIATKAFPEGGFNHADAEILIHRVASGIIRVSQRLERGDLSALQPDPVEAIVESFEQATPVKRPTAGAGGQAFPTAVPNEKPEDFDYPF